MVFCLRPLPTPWSDVGDEGVNDRRKRHSLRGVPGLGGGLERRPGGPRADPGRRLHFGFWVLELVLGILGGVPKTVPKILVSVLGGGCGELHPPGR